MTTEPSTFTLSISEPNSDAEDLDRATRQLLDELRELDVESVDLLRVGEVPEGVKSVDAALLGALVVAVVTTALPKFFDFLHAWALRREGRMVKVKVQTESGAAIEVEFSETTPPEKVKEYIKLVNASLLRHAKPK